MLPVEFEGCALCELMALALLELFEILLSVGGFAFVELALVVFDAELTDVLLPFGASTRAVRASPAGFSGGGVGSLPLELCVAVTAFFAV